MDFSSHKFREIVFQLLFALDGSGSEDPETISFLMRELSISKKHIRAGFNRAQAIWNARALLDEKISTTSEEYAFDRIQSVEKNVLRIALYEMLIEKELDFKGAISEAVRLTCKFGTKEGSSFVNAILDAVHKKSENASEPSLPLSSQ